MSKGNCARRGYKVDCDGDFAINKKTGKQYKQCDECRRYFREDQNPKHNKVHINDSSYHYIKKYPSPRKSIYGIFKANELVYIGESKETPYRLYCHFQRKDNGCMTHLTKEERQETHSWKILWDGTDKSKQDRLMLEAVLIQALKPKYNKQWNQED